MATSRHGAAGADLARARRLDVFDQTMRERCGVLTPRGRVQARGRLASRVRSSGNAALATDLTACWRAWDRAEAALDTVRANASRGIYDRAALAATRAAIDRAGDNLARALDQVHAWFDYLDLDNAEPGH